MQATIPTGNLVTLTKPNPQGEVMIYLRYYLGKYAKKTTETESFAFPYPRTFYLRRG